MNIETSTSSLPGDFIIADKKNPTAAALAWQDITTGLKSWRIWLMLSWQDIRLRYRRSSLGPFWLTLSMAITIYTMGFLYGHLFKMDLANYYPFLAAGMLTWYLINTLIVEGTNAFIEAENYLKQMKLPYSIFILRVVCRSLIIFFHNIVVIIPILIIFPSHLNFAILFIVPALFLIAINGCIYGMIFAMLGARYRDIAQIVVSVMQIAFFLTPIMWNKNILPPHYFFVTALNPFAQYVELLRAPLMGTLPSEYAILMVLALTVIGALVCFYLLTRVRHRIIYWL